VLISLATKEGLMATNSRRTNWHDDSDRLHLPINNTNKNKNILSTVAIKKWFECQNSGWYDEACDVTR